MKIMAIIKFLDYLISIFFVFFVLIYKIFFSWIFGKHCRFIPTCSTYALSVLRDRNRYFYSKLYLILIRILKCSFFNNSKDIIFDDY